MEKMEKIMKRIIFLGLISIAFLFNSCIEEDPDLVTPPSIADYVEIRFINLSGLDESEKSVPRSLDFEKSGSIGPIEFGQTSALQRPPLDSAVLGITSDGQDEYRMDKRFKFARDLKYTFISLPTARGSDTTDHVDTLISITTTTIIPENSLNAYLKFVNGNPDSTISYSVTLGCQNGQSIFTSVKYRSAAANQAVRSGVIGVTLIRNSPEGSDVIGLFELELVKRGQYSLLVYEDYDGTERLMLLDQMDGELSALKPVIEIEQKQTNLRTINLSGETIDVGLVDGIDYFEPSADNLQNEFISENTTVTACRSNSLDTIQVMSSDGSKAARHTKSLEVMENYSLIVFKANSDTTFNTVLIEPLRLDISRAGKAVVRIVHGALYQEGMTIALGARLDTSSGEFKSGEVLTSQLAYGETSEPVLLDPGNKPVLAFTSTEPAKFRQGVNFDFQPGKNYVLIITSDGANKENITIIEDEQVTESIQYLDAGGLVQIINCAPEYNNLEIHAEPHLGKADLFYATSLVTIMPEGNHTLTAGEANYTFDVDPEKRTLVVLASSDGVIDPFHFTAYPMNPTPKSYKTRYINAKPGVDLAIKEAETDSTYIDRNIQYKGVSPVTHTVVFEKRVSLEFIDESTMEAMLTLGDIQFSFNKAYSVIFDGQSAIIQQEY